MLVGDHGHVGRRAVGERLDEQQVGAPVRGHLPGGRIADRDVLDLLVLAEADRRLDVGAAFDPDHLVGVVEPLDEARIVGAARGAASESGSEQRCGEQGAGHLNFSMERARRALAGARKRLPMPRARDSEALALAAGEARRHSVAAATIRVSRRRAARRAGVVGGQRCGAGRGGSRARARGGRRRRSPAAAAAAGAAARRRQRPARARHPCRAPARPNTVQPGDHRAGDLEHHAPSARHGPRRS